MANQSTRIAALEEQIRSLGELLLKLQDACNAAIVPVAQEVQRAHERINEAGRHVKALEARTPIVAKREPTYDAADRKAWYAALHQLRTERGLDETAFVKKADVQARIIKNREAAK
jgi:hypothetical protein